MSMVENLFRYFKIFYIINIYYYGPIHVHIVII